MAFHPEPDGRPADSRSEAPPQSPEALVGSVARPAASEACAAAMSIVSRLREPLITSPHSSRASHHRAYDTFSRNASSRDIVAPRAMGTSVGMAKSSKSLSSAAGSQRCHGSGSAHTSEKSVSSAHGSTKKRPRTRWPHMPHVAPHERVL